MVWILSNTAGPFHTLEQCFNWLSHQSILLPSLFYRMPLSTRIGVLWKQSAAESAVMHMYSHRCTCMAHCAQWVMRKASAPNKRINSPTAQAQYACWGQRLPEGRDWLQRRGDGLKLDVKWQMSTKQESHQFATRVCVPSPMNPPSEWTAPFHLSGPMTQAAHWNQGHQGMMWYGTLFHINKKWDLNETWLTTEENRKCGKICAVHGDGILMLTHSL